MTKEREREGPERGDKQLGEGVAMATKVVKSFKEKVINAAIWPESQKNTKQSPFNLAIRRLL